MMGRGRRQKNGLILGDAVEKMRGMPEASIHAVVTDPPAGIAFMSMSWDGDKGGRGAWIEWMTGVMQECLRVLKPGGHALVWALPRTSHWTATAVENAGFEIRDIVMHIFGSGFPKSLDIGKAIDQRPGVVLHKQFCRELTVTREKAGLSCADVSEHVVGTRSGACWNWEHHQFPEFRHWALLSECLPGLDQKWSKILEQADREVVGQGTNGIGGDRPAFEGGYKKEYEITSNATENAKRWAGWGTSLKPAAEHWILARKKPMGTIAQNTLEHGVGGINVDACRVGTDKVRINTWDDGAKPFGGGAGHEYTGRESAGRWPPHLALSHSEGCRPIGTREVRGDNRGDCQGKRPGGFGDVGVESGDAEPNAPVYGDEVVEAWECVEGCPVRELDRQSGVSKSTGGQSNNALRSDQRIYGKGNDRVEKIDPGKGDTGGASRFFPCFRYQAKPSTAEKEAGCEHLEGGNSHKTVKGVDLMRWLVRLVTPPKGLVLDPFMGSGTTGIACHKEGFRFIGIEKDEGYHQIAVARIQAATAQGELFDA